MSTRAHQRIGWRRLAVRLGMDIRQDEVRRTLLLFLAFFGIITFQYMAKTMRQSTFIDALGATRLPYVYLLVALTAYPVLKLYLRLSHRFTLQRLLRLTCLVSALSMVIFWILFTTGWSWVPMLFYLWVSITFVALVSQFWSFSGQAMDSRQARRLFSAIGAGGLLGSIVGGQAARLVHAVSDASLTLLVGAGVLMAVALLLSRVAPGASAAAPPASVAPEAATGGGSEDSSGQAGLRTLWASPHLRMICLVLLLGVITGQAIDLQFSWAVEQATTDLGQRVAWFGNFFSGMGVAAFLFQVLLTSRIHRVLGVGFALQVLPVITLFGGVMVLAAAGFFPEALVAAALSLKLGETGLRYSLDQSTRELLFMPVPARLRLQAKAIIDVFLQRFSKGIAALLLLPVSFGWISPVQVGWQIMVLSLAWMVAAAVVARTYVGSFRSGLRDRSVDTAATLNLTDVKTVELLVESLGSTDARQVLHSLEILQANGRGHLVPPLLLYHDDAKVRRQTLVILAGLGRADTAPLVERCLADDDPEVRAEAIGVLTGFNSGDACSLMRPRLQEGEPRVKAAAVTCLVNHGSRDEVAEAMECLRYMLLDAAGDVRAEAVKAMGAVHGDRFQGQLVGALDDTDHQVSRQAILAVQRVVAREGFNPLFLPRLVSMLQDRRLKADAREALVAFGAPAIPILVHFLNDKDESVFVRRALPRVLARMKQPEVVECLLDALVRSEDAFLRAQLVEALASRRDEIPAAEARILAAVKSEARHYIMRLADISALVEPGALPFVGPVPAWDRSGLNLLVQMISERLEDHLKTMFGMLALMAPPADMGAAYRSLMSGQANERAHALEYLDNTLSGDLRRIVFAVIDDAPLMEKLQHGLRLFQLETLTRTDSVRRLLDAGIHGDDDARALAVAGLYTLYSDELKELYPLVTQVQARSRDPLIQETAAWVGQRLSLQGSGA